MVTQHWQISFIYFRNNIPRWNIAEWQSSIIQYVVVNTRSRCIVLALNTGMIPINLIRWHALRGLIVVMNRGTWYLNRVLKPYIVCVRYGLRRGALRRGRLPRRSRTRFEKRVPWRLESSMMSMYTYVVTSRIPTPSQCIMTLRRALTRIFIDLLRPTVWRDHWQTSECLGNNWSVRYANYMHKGPNITFREKKKNQNISATRDATHYN